MMNLTALQATPAEINEHLPIPYVMDSYGHRPEMETAGRLHYRNPFRQDNNPSFDVFRNGDGTQRWGDFAWGEQGSVIDLIQHFEQGASLGDALKVARTLYASYLDDGWGGPRLTEYTANSEPDIDDEVWAWFDGLPRLAGTEVMFEFVQDRPSVDLAVIQAFDVRQADGHIAIPYPGRRAIRFRWDDGSKTTASGSKLGAYHRPDLDLDAAEEALLVEGESDTWAAEGVLGEELAVVGIPGVGQRPEKYVELFAGKEVAIAFDGDQPGRDGALRWAEALAKTADSVSLVPVPDGMDIAGLPAAEIRAAFDARRPLSSNVTDLIATDKGYAKVAELKDGETKATLITDWTVEPIKILRFEDTGQIEGWEVEVTKAGNRLPGTYVLRVADLMRRVTVATWCGQFRGTFSGTEADASKLVSVIDAGTNFVPVERTVTRPGLYGGTFVWPGGKIGPGSITCVADSRNPLSTEAMDIRTGGSDWTVLRSLMGLRDDDLLWPAMAWLSMAPLRSLLTQFPTLFITGRAGSGKTTVAQRLAHVMSGVPLGSTNLTSTTPYALALTMGGTNSLPTVFDEYRPGARKGTIEMMDQLIRDAYNASPSRRGGLTSDKSAVTVVRTDNPLLVVGEDFADEQSHRDRLIKVFLPKDGKGRLFEIYDEHLEWAGTYLQWLVDTGRSTTPPVVVPSEAAGLSERQAYNVGVIVAGWSLLSEFAAETFDEQLQPIDVDALVEGLREETSEDAVLTAIRDAFESIAPSNAIWTDDDDALYVSSSQLLAEMRRLGLPLPFATSRALSNYLVSDFGGESVVRKAFLGTQKIRYIRLDQPWTDEVGSDA